MDGDDEWEEDQFEEFESILKLCKASGLRELPLQLALPQPARRTSSPTRTTPSTKAGSSRSPGPSQEADDLGVKFYPRHGRRLPARHRTRQPRRGRGRRRAGHALGSCTPSRTRPGP